MWRDRSYTASPLEMPDFDKVAAVLKMDRAVVIQPSVYAEDNAAVLQAIAASLQMPTLNGTSSSTMRCEAAEITRFGSRPKEFL